MKLLILFSLGLVAAKPSNLPVFQNYHEEVGIPIFNRIEAQESALDFDGSKIVGGTPAGAGAAPHLVGVVIALDHRTSFCGASMLSNSRSVTAAHCWKHRHIQARQFTLVFGSSALLTGGVRVATVDVRMHEGYSEVTLENDLAMINHNWVGYNNVINRILLPSGSNSYVGVWAHAAGYGWTNDAGGNAYVPFKHEVWLQVITNAECASVYNHIFASTICTSGVGSVGTCGGDSGGPLAIGSGNNRQLIGVISFGHAFCLTGRPSAYIRVTSFVPWILARM